MVWGMASHTDQLIHEYAKLPARSPNSASSITPTPFLYNLKIKSFNFYNIDGRGLNPHDCALLALVVRSVHTSDVWAQHMIQDSPLLDFKLLIRSNSPLELCRIHRQTEKTMQ
jgi:hypothetical protein